MITIICPYCGAHIRRDSENDLTFGGTTRPGRVKSCYAHLCMRCKRTIRAGQWVRMLRVTLAECE